MMAGAKSEKETWLNYTIQPLTRVFVNDISSVQQLFLKDWHVFFSTNPLYRFEKLFSVYYSFDPQ
jgi:hypothetical protein